MFHVKHALLYFSNFDFVFFLVLHIFHKVIPTCGKVPFSYVSRETFIFEMNKTNIKITFYFDIKKTFLHSKTLFHVKQYNLIAIYKLTHIFIFYNLIKYKNIQTNINSLSVMFHVKQTIKTIYTLFHLSPKLSTSGENSSSLLFHVKQ